MRSLMLVLVVAWAVSVGAMGASFIGERISRTADAIQQAGG